MSKSRNLLKKAVCALVCVVLGAATLPLPVYADDSSNAAPLTLESPSYYLMDLDGTELAAYNADAPMAPASITKIMTAMVVLDSDLAFDQKVTVPPMPEDWQNAQEAGLVAGSTARVSNLFKLMLIYSANDAAYTLATAVSGTEGQFIDLMNAKAQEIGMNNTHFLCSSGMEQDGHYSTARDLCKMGAYALTNYPLIKATVHQPSVTVPLNGEMVTFYSTDELLGTYPYARGIKTGAATNIYTFLGAAKKNNTTLIDCVLGCPTKEGRFTDAKALFDWAFTTCYKDVTYEQKGAFLGYRPYALRFGWYVKAFYSNNVTFTIPNNTSASAISNRVISASSKLFPHKFYPYGSVWTEDGHILCIEKIQTGQELFKKEPRNYLIPTILQP